MAHCRKPVMWVVLVVMAVTNHYSTVHASTETDANSVVIKVYPASQSDWTSSVETAFTTAVASRATTYCATSLSACSLDSSALFTSADVSVPSKSESSRSLEVTVYVSYPQFANVTSGGSTTETLPKAALKEILKDGRDDVKDLTDKYITYIDDDYYGVPVETAANRIIIPVAVVTVVVVGLSAVVMVYAQERREKEERHAARLAKKKAAKALPNYDIPDPPPPCGSSSSNTPRQTTISPAVNLYSTKHPPQIGNSKDTASFGASPTANTSVNHFHSNGNSTSGNILPPLSNNNTTNSSSNSTKTTKTTAVVDFSLSQGQGEGELRRIEEERTEEDEEKRRRRKEKKREKKRQRQLQLQQQQFQNGGVELIDAQGFDTSAMTVSENSDLRQDENIPVFTVQSGGGVEA